MKHKRIFAAIPALLMVLTGCVSSPPEKAPEPQRRERIETVRVPLLLKEMSFFANGVLDRTIAYTYDADQKNLLERTVQEPSRAEPTERFVYAYSEGRLTSVTVFDPEGGVKTKTEYEITPSGQILWGTVTDSKGAVQSSVQYEYGADGTRTARRIYDASGVLLAISEYTYTSGRLAAAVMKDAAERPAGRIEHEYDTQGRLLERTTFAPDGSASQRERFTYKDGVLAEERTERGDGRLERRLVYEIGPEGVPIKSTLYDGSGRVRDLRTYEYVFRIEDRTVVYYE